MVLISWSTLFPYTTLFRSSENPASRRLREPVPRSLRLGVLLPPLVRSIPFPRAEGLRGLETKEARPWERNRPNQDRKSTRLNSSHANNSYAVFRLKKKKQI